MIRQAYTSLRFNGQTAPAPASPCLHALHAPSGLLLICGAGTGNPEPMTIAFTPIILFERNA
ncbi:hypothetical protein CHCC14820_4437 [Bacillus paralicheniformis]|nr:hypothetical protein CHCC14820_4437 [Bacillus paralicheniformis]